ncbi:DUF4326 domain-containing protein [Patescibacteria group bacterium]|nr:DUF4326 domain-containing protein [Patescibacteria group bacterium]
MSQIKPQVVHHKKHPHDVFIGRPKFGKYSDDQCWGNPFSHKSWATAKFKTSCKAESLIKHRQWVLGNPSLLRKIKRELAGKILGCWCDNPLACHGLVLWEVANDITPETPTAIQHTLF